jgi:hypothetical protein
MATLLQRPLGHVRFAQMDVEELMQVVYADALVDLRVVLEAVAYRGTLPFGVTILCPWC